MRKPKFKVWDKKKKEMRDLHYSPYIHNDYIWFFGMGPIPVTDEYGNTRDAEDFILLEYIGSLDENKKELCEGDIVDVKDKDWGDLKIRYYITYLEREASWYLWKNHPSGLGTGGYCPLFKHGRKFEILGNLYENPDLLS